MFLVCFLGGLLLGSSLYHFCFEMPGHMFCFENPIFDSALAMCIGLLQKFIYRLGISELNALVDLNFGFFNMATVGSHR